MILSHKKSKVAFCIFIVLCFTTLWCIITSERFSFPRKGTTKEKDIHVAINKVSDQPAVKIKKNKIMFLKTHKTGSSTVTNILNRYGVKYNLTFALPKFGSDFDWPRRIKPSSMMEWTSPHILCNHARYNKPFLHHLFPKQESFYITILREPLSNYESTFNYMELWKHINHKGNKTMDILQQYLLRVSSLKSAELGRKDRSRLLRNPMIYDLGLDFKYYQNKTAISKYINFLEKEFDLVMIMEHFDESVVLFKRMIGLEIDDVVFIEHNERQKKDKKQLSPLLQENIKSWNKADFLLYEHFNNTLWQKIAQEGSEFYKDLEQFRRRQAEIYKMCISQNKVVTEIYIDKFVQGHALKKDIPKNLTTTCQNLVKSELKFYDENIANYKKFLATLDNPGEFKDEFNKENDWANAKDFEHRPIFLNKIYKIRQKNDYIKL